MLCQGRGERGGIAIGLVAAGAVAVGAPAAVGTGVIGVVGVVGRAVAGTNLIVSSLEGNGLAAAYGIGSVAGSAGVG